MSSDFIKFSGLVAVDLVVGYEVAGEERQEVINYTLKEIEEDYNQLRGADHSLHPKWTPITGELMDAFLGQVISNMSRRPVSVPLNDWAGIEEPEEVTERVVVLPHHITHITVRGVYNGESGTDTVLLD